MSTTVNAHQQSALTTPVNNTSPIDANQVTGNDNAITNTYNSHDSDPGIHIQSSVLASRPAAGTAGRIWFTSDGLTFAYDNGSSWIAAAIAALGAANITHGTFGSATSDTNPYTFAANLVVTAQMTAGQVHLSGANTIGNATLGADATYGLAVQGSPGLTYDFTLFKAGGALTPIMTVPTSTINVNFAGALHAVGAATFDSTLTSASGTGTAGAFGSLTGLGNSGSFPTMANGNGTLYGSATLGAVLAGSGSVSDVYIGNRSGSAVLTVATGTVNAVFAGSVNMGAGLTATTGTFTSNVTVDSGLAGAFPQLTVSGSNAYATVNSVASGNPGYMWYVDGSEVARIDVLRGTSNAIRFYTPTFGQWLGVVNATGAATFGGTLGVTGAATFSTGFTVNGGDNSASSGTSIRIQPSTLTQVNQYGIILVPNFNSAATVGGVNLYARVNTAAAAFTMAAGIAIQIDTPTIGAASAVTTLYGVKIEDQTGGATNYALYTGAGLIRLGGAITTASTLTLGGILANTVGNNSNIIQSTSATTGWQAVQMTNTSGNAVFAVEGSAGGTVFTGSTAYATLLGTGVAQPLQLVTGGVVRATIASGGAVTVNTTLGVGAPAVTTTNLAIAAASTGASSLRILSGAAPTSPVDGDMWYDGTNVKFRVGGATKTFTLV